MKSLLILTILLIVSLLSFSQEAKKISKAVKVFDKDYNRGIGKIRKLMAKETYPTLQAFEVLVKMEYYKYKKQLKLWDNIEITATDKDGNELEDSSSFKLMADIKSFNEDFFVDVCRRSSLESFSHTADMHLRVLTIEEEIDTGVREETWDIFTEGMEYFSDGKMELAELNFRKALDAKPDFYVANMYLGRTFWQREMYDSAKYFYELLKENYPTKVEPRNNVIDCLIGLGLYFRAKKECMEVMFLYPGHDAKYKYNQVLSVENKWMNDHRFTRYSYPNDISKDKQHTFTGHWTDYREAKKQISKYCDEDGIIEENGITQDKYLEVYSFRHMLEENEESLPDIFNFPLKMEEEGYLEPFVFISMFHIDFYPQLKHYMSFEENRKKSKEYINRYLIENRN